jgi:hypothetical protein
VVVRRRTIPKIGVSTLFSNEIKTGVSIDFFILLGNIFIGKEGTDPDFRNKNRILWYFEPVQGQSAAVKCAELC